MDEHLASPDKDSVSVNRRTALKYGLCGLIGATAVGTATWHWWNSSQQETPCEVFKQDAPDARTWSQWQRHGWIKEAYHYLQLGRNVQCKVCPNNCLLEPGDRSRCRNKVNRDGKLYSMTYGNPCAFHLDPIEKKPLYHFLPQTPIFSIATSGCVFRCLNCQNWEISQSKPEQNKDAQGEPLRFNLEMARTLTAQDARRLTMLPEDVVDTTLRLRSPSIAYTYTEPTAFYEYMYDTARLARSRGIKNVWVTCGYIQESALVDLCSYLDAANVDLKSFRDDIYRDLNSGRLQPVLDALKILKQRNIWFEITNLVVPTYTDRLDMIQEMCAWILANLGPDYPLHFSAFHPAYKLTQLHVTPLDILVRARDIARRVGLHYVYLGNVRAVEDADTTFCPACKRAIVTRDMFMVRDNHIRNGRCEFCGQAIAGVWSL